MPRPIMVLCLLCPAPALAAQCDDAADRAAAEWGVPPALMRAITRVETARGGAPWPWVLNVDGQGLWFDTKDGAVQAADLALRDGVGQIDLGCFQLNMRWHGAQFASLDQMLDPDENARHAARFLSELRDEFGDWRAATAAYHSRTDTLGQAYVGRVEAAHAASAQTNMAQTPLAQTATDQTTAYQTGTAATDQGPAPRVAENGFPLLVLGGQGLGGSVVPLPVARAPIIGGP